MAIMQNPFVGCVGKDLSPPCEVSGQLGERLMGDAVLLSGAALSYGKAAIVGISSYLEHGGAIIHPKLGKRMPASIGGGKALIAYNAKAATMGTPILD